MGYLINVTTLVALYTILGISLNWLLGYAGMFSVAHGAFLGVAAYATAITETRWGLSPVVATLVAIVLTTVLGTALGYTAIRVSGEFLIIVSFGLQEVASSVFVNAGGLTGGASGIVLPTASNVFGLPPNTSSLVLVGVLAILALVASRYFARSKRLTVGLAVRALNEDEIAVASCGRSVRGLKLWVHAASFGLVGLAGALYAHMLQFVAPEDFSLDTSVLVLTVVAIGGAANSFGPLLGAVVVVGLPQLLTFTPLPTEQAIPIQQAIYGGLLVLFMLFRRQGLLNPDYRPTRAAHRSESDGTTAAAPAHDPRDSEANVRGAS